MSIWRKLLFLQNPNYTTTTLEPAFLAVVLPISCDVDVLEIQDGSQLTGSTDIFETMTYTINIPTTNLRHSTMANSHEVYLGDSNNDRQSENGERNRKYLNLWNCEKYS